MDQVDSIRLAGILPVYSGIFADFGINCTHDYLLEKFNFGSESRISKVVRIQGNAAMNLGFLER